MLHDVRRRLKRLENLVASFGGSGAPSLARAWGDATGFTVSQGGGAGIAAHATITPLSTGKLRVIITGSIQNDSDSGQAQYTVSISHGLAATPADYTSGIFEIEDNGGGREYGSLSLVVDLDKIAAPVVFPAGTPVQINAVITVTSGGQAVQGAAHSVQIAIEEEP
jgi:hypothetical protein